uniref:Secreted protein n=1 Tax=Mesocestoides corti TaxID=53468 RepID=A0A5K3FQ17_MESCO
MVCQAATLNLIISSISAVAVGSSGIFPALFVEAPNKCIFNERVDNFSHGVSLGASFSISVRSGLVATSCLLIHEVPHEVTDFIILLRSGFSRWGAIKAQLLTASTCLIGNYTITIFRLNSKRLFISLSFSNLNGTILLNSLTPCCNAPTYVAAVSLYVPTHSARPSTFDGLGLCPRVSPQTTSDWFALTSCLGYTRISMRCRSTWLSVRSPA